MFGNNLLACFFLSFDDSFHYLTRITALSGACTAAAAAPQVEELEDEKQQHALSLPLSLYLSACSHFDVIYFIMGGIRCWGRMSYAKLTSACLPGPVPAVKGHAHGDTLFDDDNWQSPQPFKTAPAAAGCIRWC